MFTPILKILIEDEKYSTFSASIDSIFITHTAVSQEKKALEIESNIVLRDRISQTPALTMIIHAIAASTKKFVNTQILCVTPQLQKILSQKIHMLCSKYKILIYMENW